MVTPWLRKHYRRVARGWDAPWRPAWYRRPGAMRDEEAVPPVARRAALPGGDALSTRRRSPWPPRAMVAAGTSARADGGRRRAWPRMSCTTASAAGTAATRTRPRTREWAVGEAVRRYGDVPVCLVGMDMGARAALRAAGHPAVNSVGGHRPVAAEGRARAASR